MKLSEIEVGKIYLAQQQTVSTWASPWRMKVKVLGVGVPRTAEHKLGRYHTQNIIKQDGVRVEALKDRTKKLLGLNTQPTWPNEGNHPEPNIHILRPQEIVVEWTPEWEAERLADIAADEKHKTEAERKLLADEAKASKLNGRLRKLGINASHQAAYGTREFKLSLDQMERLVALAEGKK